MQDYIKLAIKTEAPYSELPTRVGSIQVCRLLHASIGLCTEIGELLEAVDKPEFKDHAKEEIGDLWWYLAIAFDAAMVPFSEIDPDKDGGIKSMIIRLGKLIP